MRLAQLSDLHLLEPGFHRRSWLSQFRARFLSIGRPVDAADRRARFVAGLKKAVAAGFDRLLLSGDLTEEGTPEQFAEVNRVLDEANIDRSRIITFAGNHDAYAGASLPLPAIIDDGPVSLIPVDTVRQQHYLFSAGEIADGEWARVLAAIRERQGQTIVLLMHHPPQKRASWFMQFMDGLRNAELVQAALREFSRLHVIHGHTHHFASQIWPGSAVPRVFSPRSVVTGDVPLRLYRIDADGVGQIDGNAAGFDARLLL
jgi:Icc protein